MKFKIRYADQISGIFILIALIAIAAILILMGVNQDWFSKKYHYISTFNSASGINVGMSIMLRGFRIGSVEGIELLDNENHTVRIKFYIEEAYIHKVRPNSVLELTASPLGLGGGLQFYPSKIPGDPPPEGSTIFSTDSKQGFRLVKEKAVSMPAKTDTISAILNDIQPILTNVDEAVVNLNTLIRSVNSAFAGDTSGPVGQIMVEVSSITSSLDEILAEVSRQIDDIMADITHLTGELSDPTGLVTKLLDPKGSIAAILDDDNALFSQIELILTNLNATILELKDFTSYINTTTPQISGILEDSREALDKGKDVLEGLSNNPLLRGGISDQPQQSETFQSYRDEEF
ncbi:MAG: MCE family protein [Spirochaetales bacterium]|nr:MCE family protein [Spirochaetales bacterium]